MIKSSLLDLTIAIVIYRNALRLGEAVLQRKRAGLSVEPGLLAHISPLGWAHIPLTGEYRWPRIRWPALSVEFRPLPDSTP